MPITLQSIRDPLPAGAIRAALQPNGEVLVYMPGDTLPPDPPPGPPPVPSEVTMRQARLALHAAGLLSSVEAAIDALPDPPRSAARIEWDHSQTVQRNRGIVQQLGTALGMSSAQLDALFIAAGAIP